MAECMHESGVLIVKDPRVSMQDNETFLSMLERYFEQPAELKKQGRSILLFYFSLKNKYIIKLNSRENLRKY
jgi:hypothetical protein